MTTQTTDFSSSTIASVKNTYNFFKAKDISSNNLVAYDFTIDVDFDHVELQSVVFSDNFITHKGYSFNKIFETSDESVKGLLSELFIYSYFKCLYNSLFSGTLDAVSDLGYCFSGHSKMYHLMTNPNFHMVKDQVTINGNIRLGSLEERRIKVGLFLSRFPFLNEDREFMNSFGTSPLYIRKYENLFNALKENFYARRTSEEPEVMGMELTEVPNKKLRNIKPEENSKGKIEIVKVKDPSCSTILKDSKNPIFNAMMGESSDVFYFTETSGSHKAKNNSSLFFCKANQIRLKRSCNDWDFLTSSVYRSFRISEKENFIICSEVYAITGIDCAYFGKRNTDRDRIQLPKINFEELLKLVVDNYGRSFTIDEVIDLILNFESVTTFKTKIELDGKKENKSQGK